MPKPVALSPALVETAPSAPPTSTPPRSGGAKAILAPKAPKPETTPLQLRLPRQEVRAIKIAAAESEQSISDFMLACFHACMKTGKQA